MVGEVRDGSAGRANLIRGAGVLFALGWAALSWPGLAGLGAWGVGAGVAVVALLVACLARGLVARLPALILRPSAPAFVATMALLAAGISYGLLRLALNGHGLSIDASVYLYEARALAHGAFGMPVISPMTPFGGRFLFEGPSGAMYGVFPPGYPLFLVPFVWMGVPHLAGPAVSALLVPAQYALGRVATRDELSARVSLLLALPSCARAFETSDLLSHAFVALLAATSVAIAWGLAAGSSAKRRAWLSMAVGGAVAWAFSARLLDGLVIGGVVAAILIARVVTRRLPVSALAWAALGALPFVVLIAMQQHAATGSYARPTQSEYFVRSDYPPTCHRLGFGQDVGCSVEHGDSRAAHGADGYTLDDALRVTRERARVFGDDLFAVGALLLLAFVPLMRRPRAAEAMLATFVVALTLTYGLFYYGNAPLHGARHLFPAAPFAYVLVARALTAAPHRTALAGDSAALFGARHAAAAAIVAALAVILVGERHAWSEKTAAARSGQGTRSDLRATLDHANITRGILKSRDPVAVIAATDTFADDASRIIVLDDRSGVQELRRAHPDLPMFNAMERNEVGTFPSLKPPAPGLLVELERAWPSFVRPSGIASRVSNPGKCCGITGASGENVLELFVAEVGASIAIPFGVADAGVYALRIDGLVGPSYGSYALDVDGEPLTTYDGYAPTAAAVKGAPAAPRALAAGRHVLHATCTGRAPESTGYLAAFDALVGSVAR